MNRPALLLATLSGAVLFLAAACEGNRPLTSPNTDQIRSPSAAAVGNSAVDVPESYPGILPTSAMRGASTAALEAAVRAAGDLAMIVLKSPTAAPSSAAGGFRARIPAADVEQALASLRGRTDVQVLEYFRRLGIVYVRLAPGAATALRRSPFTDDLEPAGRHVTPARSPVRDAGVMPRRLSAAAAFSGAPLMPPGTQVTPWNVNQVQAPGAWSYSTGFSTKVMLMFDGLQDFDPDFPSSIPAANCGGYLHACGGAPYILGTLEFGVMFPRNNSFGVVGVAPGVQGSNIYLWNPWAYEGTDSMYLDASMEIAGLNTAIENGVRIVFADFVYTDPYPSETDAFAEAYADSITVVTAPLWFQNGLYEPANTYHPSSFPHVITVSGVDPSGAWVPGGTCSDVLWYTGSDYGPEVSLAAPISALTTEGDSIYYDLWYTYPGHACDPGLAAAHVVGIAALLQDQHPTWGPGSILARLESSASGGGTRINDYLGYGVVNATQAVAPAPPAPLTNYIYFNDPPYYTSQPSGGYPPYQYRWDWCVSNCSLGASPSLPIQGWQYLAATQTVRWTVVPSWLRSTVTDSQGQQAVAYHNTGS